MQIQKIAKTSAKVTTLAPARKTNALADRAKKARAMLKSISTPSLRTLRNRVLDEALKRFERKDGWLNGTLKNYQGGFCGVGAIQESKESHATKEAAINAIAAVVPKYYRTKARDDYGDLEMYGFDNGGVVVAYNDSQRTKTKVVAAFKKAKKQPLRKDES